MTISDFQKNFVPAIAPEDFFILLSHATGKEKTFLLAHPQYQLTPNETAQAKNYCGRRLKHEPVAYIVGYKEFYGRSFSVTKNTLIPRPETEFIVEKALHKLNYELGMRNYEQEQSNAIAVIDVGTGSGNIIISLAKEISYRMPHATYRNFIAIDISKAALAVAIKNARQHQVDKVITFLEGDLLEPIEKKWILAKNIIITANLPYLSRDIYHHSPQDVRNYEPKSALISEQAGLGHYYRLFESLGAFPLSSRNISLFLEISPEQSVPLHERILAMFPQADITIHQDLAGKDRVVETHIDWQ